MHRKFDEIFVNRISNRYISFSTTLYTQKKRLINQAKHILHIKIYQSKSIYSCDLCQTKKNLCTKQQTTVHTIKIILSVLPFEILIKFHCIHSLCFFEPNMDCTQLDTDGGETFLFFCSKKKKNTDYLRKMRYCVYSDFHFEMINYIKLNT